MMRIPSKGRVVMGVLSGLCGLTGLGLGAPIWRVASCHHGLASAKVLAATAGQA
jgi:hypothetical protein